jgi:uncharacterized RDD family membrane protein YckC
MAFVAGLVKDLVFTNWSFSVIDYFLMMGVIAFLYFVITESIFGYTLGKRIFDLSCDSEWQQTKFQESFHKKHQ